MKTFCLSLLMLASVGAASAATAQTATPAVAHRQAHQRARIKEGVRSGELTRTEAARLRAREADIREDKREARADGVVTPGERHEIRRDTRQASRAIYRQKHDAQTRH